jgi:serine phosphatase RsbU (regulator of sigma subunit)
MRTLIGWDDPSEAELLQLYLNTDDNSAQVATTGEELLAQARQGDWDSVLLALTFPTGAEEGFRLFQDLQTTLPEVPVVVGCRPTEVLGLPRFLIHGARSHLIRDSQGDFIFLVRVSLDSAVQAARADEARKLAQRLREEMDSVRRIQESIIPRSLKTPPGYRVVARYEPAQVNVFGERPVVLAGGDYYDLFRPDERTLVLLIGDASGHGLKACMSIMTMHTLIRMLPGNLYRDTAAFVAQVNERLCENTIVQSGEGFITLFYAAVDTVENTLTWTSAGHPVALLHRLETDEVVPVGGDEGSGMPLGIAPGMEYSSSTIKLPSGSRVLIYSDGLTDAAPMNHTGYQAFGVRGIVDALRYCRQRSLEETLAHLFQASHSFTRGNGRHDDTSVAMLELA